MGEKELPFSEQHYFASYDHYGIHEEMLKDSTRTLSYRNAIYQNRHMFAGKVVLDVGCGTGILSMFAARAGAKHVVGVDMSSIIDMAKELVELNGMSDKITLIRGKLEEVKLPFDKVDIIISEWMGYFLLYESMLDTVILARDLYLKPDGIMFPDKASIYLAGIEDGEYKEEKIGFWQDVYGFDFSPIMKVALREPLVDTVEIQSVVTNPCKVLSIDLYTVTVDDLAFTSDFTLTANRNDFIHAIIAWFDIEFSKCHKPIMFSTGPQASYTHWKQTVFYLHDIIPISTNETINGKIVCVPNKSNHRHLDISIKYDFVPEDADERKRNGDHSYRMC